MATRKASLTTLREIVKEGQAYRVRFLDGRKTVYIDVFTASAILAVYDAASQEHKEKIEQWTNGTIQQFMKLARIAIKATGKG